MFESFDGTGTPPRQIQRDFLKFVEENWGAPVNAGTLPCGSGKSYLAKSIMEEVPGTVYITANNVLVKQMKDFYPDLNVLIGKKHYTCVKSPLTTCEDAWRKRSHRPCGNCDYYKARQAALRDKVPTCYNAISYWFSMLDPAWVPPKVLIIDEADKLVEMMMLVSGSSFGPRFNPPKNLEFIDVADWLRSKETLLQAVVERGDNKVASEAIMDIDRIQRTL